MTSKKYIGLRVTERKFSISVMTCSFADLSSHKIKIQVGEKRFTEVYLLLLNNEKYHFTKKVYFC